VLRERKPKAKSKTEKTLKTSNAPDSPLMMLASSSLLSRRYDDYDGDDDTTAAALNLAALPPSMLPWQVAGGAPPQLRLPRVCR